MYIYLYAYDAKTCCATYQVNVRKISPQDTIQITNCQVSPIQRAEKIPSLTGKIRRILELGGTVLVNVIVRTHEYIYNRYFHEFHVFMIFMYCMCSLLRQHIQKMRVPNKTITAVKPNRIDHLGCWEPYCGWNETFSNAVKQNISDPQEWARAGQGTQRQ